MPTRWTSRRTSATWRSPPIRSAIHLFARAIVVDDGSTCAVLVGMDLGGAPNQIVDDAISRAAKATGCPAQNFIISATHTHSSNTQGLGQGPPTAKTVADAIVEAATVAKSRLAPARVGYGTTTVDLNVNRDLFNRKLEWRQEPNPDGPSDKTLAVVEFLGGQRCSDRRVHELRDAPDQLLPERRHQRRLSGRGVALRRGPVR